MISEPYVVRFSWLSSGWGIYAPKQKVLTHIDLVDAANQANQSVDYFNITQGIDPQNTWAQFKTFADAVTAHCVELMPDRYLTLLGGADVFLEDNCFVMSETLRIDMVQPGK